MPAMVIQRLLFAVLNPLADVGTHDDAYPRLLRANSIPSCSSAWPEPSAPSGESRLRGTRSSLYNPTLVTGGCHMRFLMEVSMPLEKFSQAVR